MKGKTFLILLLIFPCTLPAAQKVDSIFVDIITISRFVEKSKNKRINVFLKDGRKQSGKLTSCKNDSLVVEDSDFKNISHGQRQKISERIAFDQIAHIEVSGQGPSALMIVTLISTVLLFISIGSKGP